MGFATRMIIPKGKREKVLISKPRQEGAQPGWDCPIGNAGSASGAVGMSQRMGLCLMGSHVLF